MAVAMNSIGNNMFEIGAFEAKTYFSELLRKVQDGAIINISKNGKQVAVLQGKQTVQNSKAMDAHKRIMERSQKFSTMREKSGSAGLTSKDLWELKNEGRKY